MMPHTVRLKSMYWNRPAKSSLYIAQVKQKYEIMERENYNKPKSENFKQPKCPPEKEVAITEALKYFGMI